jgi:hypothetical protein
MGIVSITFTFPASRDAALNRLMHGGRLCCFVF